MDGSVPSSKYSAAFTNAIVESKPSRTFGMAVVPSVTSSCSQSNSTAKSSEARILLASMVGVNDPLMIAFQEFMVLPLLPFALPLPLPLLPLL
eukprot:CAMPEP_0203729028 /NCGR_PEP_ID=MMETSP0092-20131115/15584_1 /ASSEMBLY_ACC=CAM_ASM_001090 /TAXON_ID=426623 /ORGANISM="Chaetoceros affinis, Strain CCMP159" /LENGTH=92 /DNA_ID=CAMNT_0050611267 /DNA_START=289 /DNA_END=567 /DNA_ORIENTATION=+